MSASWRVIHLSFGGFVMVRVRMCFFGTMKKLPNGRRLHPFANHAKPETLNRATGAVLVVLGVVILGVPLFA